MKYIDAEKLIAEIKRQQRNLIFLSNTEQVGVRRDCALQNGVYAYILELVASLQQEQPEVDFEVKFAEFLERKDAELGAKSWSEDDLRELALYFYYGRNNDKQSEVDLDKEVQEWKNKHGVVGMDNLWLGFALHFYELGFSARKV